MGQIGVLFGDGWCYLLERAPHEVILLFRRTCFIGLLIAMPAAFAAGGGDSVSIRRLIRDASRALQAGNAPLFLAAFDRESLADFGHLSDEVFALTAQRRIASSVENGPIEQDGEFRIVRVDWLLQLTPMLDPGAVEKREQEILLRLTKRKGRWKIVAIDAPEFFRAR